MGGFSEIGEQLIYQRTYIWQGGHHVGHWPTF